MSLAETTAALSKKESEKSQVLEDIKNLELLKDQNIVAKLNVSVYEIVGLPLNSIAVLNYGLIDGRYVEKVDTHYITKVYIFYIIVFFCIWKSNFVLF